MLKVLMVLCLGLSLLTANAQQASFFDSVGIWGFGPGPISENYARTHGIRTIRQYSYSASDSSLHQYFSYDIDGHLAKYVNYANEKRINISDSNVYDKSGRLIERYRLTPPSGDHETHFYYRYSGDTVFTESIVLHSYGTLDTNHLVEIKDPWGNTVSSREIYSGQTRSSAAHFQYDAQHRLRSAEYFDPGTQAWKNTQRYYYRSSGRQTVFTEWQGNKIALECKYLDGRCMSCIWYPISQVVYVDYIYDKNGLLIGATVDFRNYRKESVRKFTYRFYYSTAER